MTPRRLPASIYWRRRLLLLAVLILIIWGLVALFGWIFAGDDEPEANPTVGTPTASTPPLSDGAVGVTLETSADTCAADNVKVVPSVAANQNAGQPVNVNLTFGTLDGTACTLDPGDAELLVVISAEKAPVYDSLVCSATFLEEPVALAAGWSSQVSTTWSGRGSGQACGNDEKFAGAGSYTIQVGTLGGEPGEAEFTLAKPTAPTPTPSPTPSVDPSAPVPLPSSEATTPAPED